MHFGPVNVSYRWRHTATTPGTGLLARCVAGPKVGDYFWHGTILRPVTPVSISAFNDAPLVVTRTRVVAVVVVVVGRVSAGRSRGSRTSVLLLSLVTH